MAVLGSGMDSRKSKSDKTVKFTGKNWSSGNQLKKEEERDLTLGMAIHSKTHLVPPRVSEALGNSSYCYPARAYPPYCVSDFPPVLKEVCEPPLPGVGDPGPRLSGIGASSSQPVDVTVNEGPPTHGIVGHPLPSESSTAQGLCSDEVRVATPSLQFPGVLMRGLHMDNRVSDILQFFNGFRILDILLVYADKSFTGDAFLVFPNFNWVHSALKKDGEKIGFKAVRVFPCRKEDYYIAVASALNVKIDFSDSLANPTDPSTSNNNLMEPPLISNSKVIADMSNPGHGHSMSLCENIMEHGHPEAKAKNILEKEENHHHGVVAPVNDGLDMKKLLNKDHHILRLCGPNYFADTNVITGVFGDCDLSEDRVHIVFHPDGKPTGEVFLELVSEEDANKVLSKDKTMIGSHFLKIFPATVHDMQAKTAEQKQETGNNDGVKESNDEPNLPDEQKKSKDKQKEVTEVLRMSDVPPSADKYDIIELFGEYNLLPENLHCECQPNGMATGVVYVEFNSVEDAKKALSKNMSKVHSQVVNISISSKEEAMETLKGEW